MRQALLMALETPPSERPAKLLAIRLDFKDRLVASGLDEATADNLMRGVTINMEWLRTNPES